MGKEAVRKRRPGGGRKPSSPHGAGAPLSVRIDPETRAALEAEAARSDKKLSTVVVKLIEDGIEHRRYRRIGSPVRALAQVMENIDQESKSNSADGKVCEWHTDPTIFETFRIAVDKALEKLRPPGEIDSSMDGPLIGRSPEEHAEAIFRRVWAGLLAAEPLTEKQASELLAQRGWSRHSREATAAWLSGLYSAVQVREALNIKPDTNRRE